MTAIKSLDEISGGVAGDLTRTSMVPVVEPHFFNGNDTDVQAGRAVEFAADGSIQYVTSGSSAVGFTTRTYPAGSGDPASTVIPKGRAIGVMRKGYMLVKCTNGTPVTGKTVHMYKQENGGHKIGEFSAATDSSYTTELTNVHFASNGVTADKLAEIQII